MPGAATISQTPPASHALPVISLAGPTAAGKTAAALAIAAHVARRFPVEIVSVDSALVYRGMDIGTAKPDAAERAAVPHHLIDILDPCESYSAAAFVADARRCIADIRARGALPLLVGGTMLYFKALFDGLDDMPPADPAVRAAIDAEAAEHGWATLHAELARVDPVTAQRLAPLDSQRIQRALEVWRCTGQPLSAFHKRGERTRATTGEPTEDTLVSLEPSERAWLHQRIEQRFDAMLAGGFLDEVRALRARGDLSPDLPSMRCVGYRQAWEYLREPHPEARHLHELRERGVAATRQLAKRQFTWLRSLPQRRVVQADTPDAVQQVLRTVDGLLGAVSA